MAFPFARTFNRILTRPAAPVRVRSFDGATGGRRGKGMGHFGRIGPETMAAGPRLRSSALYLANNNAWISQAVANWVGALVASGILPTPMHPDKDIRAALSALWSAWGETADADGRTDINGMMADVVRDIVVTGEAVVQIVDGPEGPQFRNLPPELVDESFTRDFPNGGYAVSGVEFDSSGRRVAYHILQNRPTDLFATYQAPIRVPADQILHIFKPLGPGQVRGISWLAPIILPAGDFDQLTDALLVGAKVAAMHAGFLIDLNGTSGEPYDGEAQPSLEPGTLQRLPTGYDIKFNSPGQAADLGPFIRLNLRQLAAGLGMPTHLLDGDLSDANYSSLRAGLLPFRQRVEAVQYHVLVPQLMAPIWRHFVQWAVLTGELDAPDYESSPRDYRCEWLMPKSLQVDPLRDVQATVAEIDAGLTSRRKAVAERGWPIEDIDAENAADTFRAKGAE
jgi:lambda family phage portal protein